MWGLHATQRAATRRELFVSTMRIGRDHIATTVYTIAFAYVGAALPLLLMVSLLAMPLGHTLTSGEIAEELVRTLVSWSGLVLAIPLTTGRTGRPGRSPQRGWRRRACGTGCEPGS